MEQLLPIIYMILFRLALIGAGIVCIVLGYRLFVIGVYPFARNKRNDEQISAEIAGASFTLKNAAPGTSFALFGVIIIVATFITGQPEVNITMRDNKVQELALRGDTNTKEGKDNQTRQVVNLLQKTGDGEKQNIQQILLVSSDVLNNFAWDLYQSNSRLSQAELLAELAVIAKPDTHNYLHTLAVIQFKQGKKDRAIKTLKNAYSLEPLHEYTNQLMEWRKR